jgi:hypothetical protein
MSFEAGIRHFRIGKYIPKVYSRHLKTALENRAHLRDISTLRDARTA